MKCSKCGTEFEGKFCPNCGTAADEGGKRSHKGLIIGCIVFVIAAIAAAAAVFFFLHQKQVEIVSNVQAEEFSYFDDAEQPTYAELLGEVFPAGEWKYVGGITREETITSFSGEDLTEQVPYKEVDFTAEHTYDGGTEPVRVAFLYAEEYEMVGDVELYAGDTPLGENGTGIAMLLMRELWLDGEKADGAKKMLDMPLTEVEAACCIADAKAGTLYDYPDVVCGQALEEVLPGGTWRYEPDEINGQSVMGTVIYEAEHAYTGGKETVQVELSGDMAGQTDIWAVRAGDRSLDEESVLAAVDALISVYTGDEFAPHAEKLLDAPLADMEGQAYILCVQQSTLEDEPDVDCASALDGAFQAGTWSYAGSGTVVYEAEHAYTGGKETVRFTFVADLEAGTSDLTEIAVDGTPLAAIEAFGIQAAVFDAAAGDEDAADVLKERIGDILEALFIQTFRYLQPEEYGGATFDDAFAVYFEDGSWSYQGDGKVNYDAKFVDGDISYDVSVQYEMLAADGTYGMDIYLDGEWLDDDMASQVLTNIFDYYAASVEPGPGAESEPAAATASVQETEWCSGIYYSGDLYSTISFYEDGSFDVYFNRQGGIYHCTGTVQGNELTFTGELDNYEVSGATASGVLTRRDNGDLEITITSPENYGFNITVDTGHFYRNYADGQTYQDIYESSVYDYYGYCGIYASVDEPANQLYVWKNGENTFFDFVCRGEEIAIGDLNDWQIENANDILYFDAYTPTNIEFSGCIVPSDEMIEITYISPADSVLSRRGFEGNYVLQYYYLY